MRKAGKATPRGGSSSTYGAGGKDRMTPKKPRTDMGVRKAGKASPRRSK